MKQVSLTDIINLHSHTSLISAKSNDRGPAFGTTDFRVSSVISRRLVKVISSSTKHKTLLNLIDTWTNCLEDGGQIDVIYTDFKKAFDKVPHKHLLCKLQSYGVSQELINWTESSLVQATTSSS